MASPDFCSILRDLLVEHRRFDEGLGVWVNRRDEGVRAWFHEGAAVAKNCEAMDAIVDGCGGWQAVCTAVFGSWTAALEAWQSAVGKPKGPPPSVRPDWIAFQARAAFLDRDGIC